MTKQEKDKTLKYIEDSQKVLDQTLILLAKLIKTITLPKNRLTEHELLDADHSIEEATVVVEKGFNTLIQMNAHMYNYIHNNQEEDK